MRRCSSVTDRNGYAPSSRLACRLYRLNELYSIPPSGQYLHLTYRHRINPGALIYEIQTSTDLSTWTTDGPDVEPLIPATPTGDGVTELATVRIKPSVDTPGTPGKYVRVRVCLP